MKRGFLILIAALSMQTANADWTPYMELGMSWKIEKSTDYWIQSARSWQCRDPGAQISVGFEARHIRVFLHHESFWLCGTFNHKPEVYANSLRIVWKWGGR